MMNLKTMIGSILSFLGAEPAVNPIFYQAGYEAAQRGDAEKNPHRPGTIYHWSWAKGYKDREGYDLAQW